MEFFIDFYSNLSKYNRVTGINKNRSNSALILWLATVNQCGVNFGMRVLKTGGLDCD